MKFNLLILLFALLASCTTPKHTPSGSPTASNYPYKSYEDPQRKADYEALVKGTDLDPNYSSSQPLQTDTQHYPFYVATAGYRMNVYDAAVNQRSFYCLEPTSEFVFEDTAGPCYHIWYGERRGYVLKTTVGIRKGYTKEEIALLPFDKETGTYTKAQGDYVRRILKSQKSQQNGSSTPTGDKTVHVNGYIRKDGTVVQSYYRSPPHKH